jgi:hypothetical protein
MSWSSIGRLARMIGAWAVIAMLCLQLAARFSATQRLDSLEARAAAAWCGTPGGPPTMAASPFGSEASPATEARLSGALRQKLVTAGVKLPPVRDRVGNP